MRSVLSHIVHKQFSSQYENIATEALSYILESSELAGSASEIIKEKLKQLDEMFETAKGESRN